MRLPFSHSHNHGGIIVSHPSHLVVLDAHPSADHSLCPFLLDSMTIDQPPSTQVQQRKRQPQSEEHVDPVDEDDATLVTVSRREDEKPRRFFRLGRHRGSTREERKSHSPPPGRRRSPSNKTRIRGLRRTMKRSVSLPHDLKVASEHKQVAMSCPPRQPASHHRHVSFASVQIREYSRILGDHPCCPSGPPLALGWELEREDSISLDEYERTRDPLRRSKEEFRLGCTDRREILENLVVSPTSSDSECDASVGSGCVYTRADIRKAERRLNRERAENHRAVRKMNHCFFQPVEDSKEEKDVDEAQGE